MATAGILDAFRRSFRADEEASVPRVAELSFVDSHLSS